MEFRTSKRQTGLLLLLALLFVGVCLYCVATPDLRMRTTGLFGTAFFGLGSFILTKQFLNTQPLVVFDDVGIHSYAIEYGTIPWKEIRAISETRIQGQRFLKIEVSDPEPYIARLPKYRAAFARANPSIGVSPLVVTFQGMDKTIDEALTYLRQHHPDLLRE